MCVMGSERSRPHRANKQAQRQLVQLTALLASVINKPHVEKLPKQMGVRLIQVIPQAPTPRVYIRFGSNVAELARARATAWNYCC